METMTEKEYKKKYGELGDCSHVTFNIIVNYQKKNKKYFAKLPFELQVMLGQNGEVKLANGMVWHSETKWHCHAWIEDDRFCYDFSEGKFSLGIIQKPSFDKEGLLIITKINYK